MSDNGFEGLVGRLPVSWQNVFARGVRYLSNELNSDDVRLKVHPNGVSIAIKTDKEGKRKAKEFWDEHVTPILDGD